MFKKCLIQWQKECFCSVVKFRGGPFAERRRSAELKIGAYSEALISRPRDWPDNYHISGYFFPDKREATPLSDSLQSFVDSGPAPVYIGFGSMQVSTIERLLKTLYLCAEAGSARFIVSRGWSSLNIEHVPENLIIIDSAPHQTLFPLCRGIIHHGGAGTTAAALKSGVPQMIFPKTADQPFWAKKTYEKGISGKAQKLSQFSCKKMHEYLSFFDSDTVQKKAKLLAKSISSDNGILKAIELIESFTH